MNEATIFEYDNGLSLDLTPVEDCWVEAGKSRIMLSCQHHSRTFERGSDSLYLGRQAACDVRTGTKYTSRVHACLESSEAGFHLTDMSTNGTIVRTDAGITHLLVNESMLLDTAGVISLGTPICEGDPYLVHYWCVGDVEQDWSVVM